MKLTLTRDEIKEIVRQHFQIPETTKFSFEISSYDDEKATTKLKTKPSQDDVEYDITVDSNGFITDMVPKNQDSVVPFKDHYGRTYNYENKCKICGRTFYTMVKPADICSGECLDQSRRDNKNKIKPKTTKKQCINYNHTCVICGKSFISNGPRSKYCSDECRHTGTTEYQPSSDNKRRHRAPEVRKPDGNFAIKMPKRCRLDYSIYAIKIEEFLQSGCDSIVVDPENISSAGMRDRYRVAASMFDLADKIHLSYAPRTKQLKMSRSTKLLNK